MATKEESLAFRLGHRPALDGVRGVSILVVLFHHGYLFLYGRGGFLGVDIFFVLSGLLITALLAQEWQEKRSISFKNFYTRRALRLLPALFVLVLVTSIQTLVFPPDGGMLPVFKHLLAVLFYVSNWVGGNKVIGHTWSLSIEEQFYIVWPLLFFLMLRLRLSPRQLLLVLAAGTALVAIHRARLFYLRYGGITPPADFGRDFDFRLYTGTDTRCDSLLVGCMAGVLLAWRMIPTSAWFLKMMRVVAFVSCLLLSISIVFVPIFASYLYYGGFTVIALAIASTILFLMGSPASLLSKVLQWPLLTWFGRLSYSLYLWHVSVYFLYYKLFKPFPIKSYTLRLFLPLAIEFAGSVVVACVSYYLIEQPFLRLKQRFSSVTPGGAVQAILNRPNLLRRRVQVRPEQKDRADAASGISTGPGSASASTNPQIPGL